MEQILRALEYDARLTPAQIATETGRSEDEVRMRGRHPGRGSTLWMRW